MKDLAIKEKFIELKAKGRSFDSIASELNVSKTTLIKWSQKLDREINNAQYLAYQNLTEQYKITKQERISYLMRELKKIYDALDKKDYNELPIKDLIFLKEKYDNDLRNEFSHMEYRTGEIEANDDRGLMKFSLEREITLKLE